MGIILILIPFLFFSCSPFSTASAPKEEQPILISGRVIGFDESIDPLSIKFVYNPFCCKDQISEVEFLDRTGQFSFELQNNIAQDYMLLYGEELHHFLVSPGDSIFFRIQAITSTESADSLQTNSAYKLITTHPTVKRSLQLFKTLEPLVYAPAYYDRLRKAGTADSILSVTRQAEELLLVKLDSVWQINQFSDPTLKTWANLWLKYEFKNDFLVELMRRAIHLRGAQKDSILSFNPFIPADFTEDNLQVYHSSYRYFIHHLDLLLNSLENKTGQALYREKKYDEVVQTRLNFIHRRFQGFASEVLTCQYFDQALDRPLVSDSLSAAIERFLTISNNPNFKRMLSEKYALITNPEDNAPILAVAEQLKSLSNETEQLLPQILEAHPGKLLVLDFWATWCAPCLDEFQRSYPGFVQKFDSTKVAFVFLAANSPRPLWEKTVSKLTFRGSHYLLNPTQDAALDKVFGISAIPHHALINSEGVIIRQKAPRPGPDLEEIILQELNKL